jgi:hypothetical protein
MLIAETSFVRACDRFPRSAFAAASADRDLTRRSLVRRRVLGSYGSGALKPIATLPQINWPKASSANNCSKFALGSSRLLMMLFGELTAFSGCGGLRGICPPKSRRCLKFQFCVGDFIPEGGFFVLLEGGLLIIHEKVLSTVKVVGC